MQRVEETDTPVPVFAIAPKDPAGPSRQELLDKLHGRIGSKAIGSSAASSGVANLAKNAAKDLAARYSSGTLTDTEKRHIAKLEQAWEAVGGDLRKFCMQTGIDASMVPDIQVALDAANAAPDIATATDTVIEKLAGHLTMG